MFTSTKGKQQNKVRQLQYQEQCIDHIPYLTFRDWSVHILSDLFVRQPFSKELYTLKPYSF